MLLRKLLQGSAQTNHEGVAVVCSPRPQDCDETRKDKESTMIKLGPPEAGFPFLSKFCCAACASLRHERCHARISLLGVSSSFFV